MQTLTTTELEAHFDLLMNRRGASVPLSRFEAASTRSDGLRLHLDVIEVEPGAPTVVFIPGTGAYGLIYGDLLAELADRGINAVALDPRGHGRSEGLEGDYIIDELVRDAQAAVRYARDRFGGPIFVAGSSQGGIAALYTAATDEDLAGAICHNAADLSDPANVDVMAHPRVARMLLPLLRAAAAVAPRAGVSTQMYLALLAKGHDDVKARLAKDPLSPKKLRLRTLASLSSTPPCRSLEEITTPVLLLHGEEDSLFSRAFIDRVFARLGGHKEMKLYPGADHFIATEKAPMVAADMARWIDNTVVSTSRASA